MSFKTVVRFIQYLSLLLVLRSYLISHFTIVYKHMLILTSYLELENDRWTVETSFVFNVNFYYKIIVIVTIIIIISLFIITLL